MEEIKSLIIASSNLGMDESNVIIIKSNSSMKNCIERANRLLNDNSTIYFITRGSNSIGKCISIMEIVKRKFSSLDFNLNSLNLLHSVNDLLENGDSTLVFRSVLSKMKIKWDKGTL